MKQYLKVLLVTGFLLFANTVLHSQTNNAKSARIETINGKHFYIHTVEKGQTLYGISKIYGITVDELLELNPEASTGLKKGAELKILAKKPVTVPPAAKEKKCDAMPRSKDTVVIHTVKQGETLYSIANSYKVTVETIKKINPDLSEQLSVGDVIIIHLQLESPEPVKNADIVGKINKGVSIAKQDPVDTVKSVIRPVSVAKSFRGHYEVALMIPLYLSDSESVRAENIKSLKDLDKTKSFSFIQFYEAFLIAYRQLESQGVKVTLRVYDVVNDTTRLNKILNSSEFQNVDMIVGPFFTGVFKVASRWAMQHQAFIVNPFSKRDDIISNNPFAIKMAPSVKNEAAKIVRYCVGRYPSGNVLLVHNGSSDEKKMVAALKQRFAGDSIKMIVKEVLYNEKGINGIKERFVEGKQTLVVSLITKEAIVTNFVRRLYELKKENLLVIAPIEWANYDNIETDYLESLHIHYYDSYFVDYRRPEVIEFVAEFRKEYNAEPELSKYAFQGYDICAYFVGALVEYGYGWLDKVGGFHPSLISTNILLKRRDERSGYENSDTQLFKLDNYKYIVAE